MRTQGSGSIRERKGAKGISYELRVFAGIDPITGKKVYRQETVRGTRAQAERRLARLVIEVEDENDKTSPKSRNGTHTLNELWAEYETTVLPKLKPHTRRLYRANWRNHVKPSLGWRNISDITSHTLEKLYSSLGTAGGRNGTGIGPQAIRNVHTLISAMLTAAARWEWITTPHAADIAQTPKQAQQRRSSRAPDSEVIRDLIRAAESKGPSFAAMLRLAAVTGARPAELAALRWRDLDENRYAILIDEAQEGRHEETGELLIGDTKTHQEREVAIDRGTLERVLALKPSGAHQDEFIFSEDGEPVSANAWSLRWRRLRAKVPGAENVRMYDLRHWAGTVTAEQHGAQVAQHKLGHARLETTGVYVRSRRPADALAADTLAKELERRRFDRPQDRR